MGVASAEPATEVKKPGNPATGSVTTQLPNTDNAQSGVTKKPAAPVKTDTSKPAPTTAYPNGKPASAEANANGKPAPAGANTIQKPAPTGANTSGKPAPAAPATGRKPTLPNGSQSPVNAEPTEEVTEDSTTAATTASSPTKPALQCPGGGLTACVQVCPGSSACLYGACIQGCGDRCQQ